MSKLKLVQLIINRQYLKKRLVGLMKKNEEFPTPELRKEIVQAANELQQLNIRIDELKNQNRN